MASRSSRVIDRRIRSRRQSSLAARSAGPQWQRGRGNRSRPSSKSNILDEAFGGIRGAAEHNCHLRAAAPLEDFHRDFVGMTPHLKVDAGLLELQMAQHQLVQE